MSLSRGKNTWYIPGANRDGKETDLQAFMLAVEEEIQEKLPPWKIRKYRFFGF